MAGFIFETLRLEEGNKKCPSGREYSFRNPKYNEATKVEDPEDIEYLKSNYRFREVKLKDEVKKIVKKLNTKKKVDYTEKEVWDMNKLDQTRVIKRKDPKAVIPKYEKDRVALISKLYNVEKKEEK